MFTSTGDQNLAAATRQHDLLAEAANFRLARLARTARRSARIPTPTPRPTRTSEP